MTNQAMTRTNTAITEVRAPTFVVGGDLDVFKLGKTLAESGYFKDANDAAKAVVKILAGQELGIGPIQSMMGIHIIEGKPSLSAGLMASIIKRSGRYSYTVKQLDDNGCVLIFTENGTPIGASSFTRKDAEAAGRSGGNWKSYFRNMAFARALSNGAKWYCPDVFGGPVYVPEEMGAVVDGDTGEVLAEAPTKTAPEPPPKPTEITKKAVDAIMARADEKGIGPDQMLTILDREFKGAESVWSLTPDQANHLYKVILPTWIALTPEQTDDLLGGE